MADAAIGLLSDPSTYARFSSRAKARAREEFDAARIVPQYERLYERLL
jgi:glycosyltransferase involved in cell wall biosynthesis